MDVAVGFGKGGSSSSSCNQEEEEIFVVVCLSDESCSQCDEVMLLALLPKATNIDPLSILFAVLSSL